MNPWSSVFSDLFVNLAAGWLGAVIILPVAIKSYKVNKVYLLINIFCAIFSLVTAVILKSI